MPGETYGLAAEIEAFKREIEKTPEGSLGDRIERHQLVVRPSLFQLRGEGEESEKHISDLARVLRGGDELEPILVFPLGDRAVVIDGHHRKAAYDQVKAESVPIRIFIGTVEEALREAGRENARHRLPMTAAQRQECAWRLTKVPGWSISQIMEASGVSKSQVQNMRKVLSEIGPEEADGLTWVQARRRTKGVACDLTSEEITQRIAEAIADRLANVFGTKLTKNPEAFALALEFYFGRKFPELQLCILSDYEPGDEFNPDF